MAKKDIYYNSLEVAQGNGELEQYYESRNENIVCARAIDSAITDSNYELYHYDLGSAAQKMIEEYGMERVKLVLANTVDYMDYDGRFSTDNKKWGAAIFVHDGDKRNRSSYLLKTHPAILDGFINRVRDYERAVEVANFIIQQGTENTTQGNWIVAPTDIPENLIEPWRLKANKELIVNILSQREEVADVSLDDGSFDVCYNLAYCPSYEPTPEEIAEHGENWPTGELMEMLQDVAGSIYENDLQHIVDERRFTAHEDIAHDLTPAQVKRYQDIIAGFLKEQDGVSDVQVEDGGFSVEYYYEHTPVYVPAHRKQTERPAVAAEEKSVLAQLGKNKEIAAATPKTPAPDKTNKTNDMEV